MSAIVQHQSNNNSNLFPNDWTSINDVVVRRRQELEVEEKSKRQREAELKKEEELFTLRELVKAKDAKVEQLQQELIARDKALKSISFAPNPLYKTHLAPAFNGLRVHLLNTYSTTLLNEPRPPSLQPRLAPLDEIPYAVFILQKVDPENPMSYWTIKSEMSGRFVSYLGAHDGSAYLKERQTGWEAGLQEWMIEYDISQEGNFTIYCPQMRWFLRKWTHFVSDNIGSSPERDSVQAPAANRWKFFLSVTQG